MSNGASLGCDGSGSGTICFNQLTTPVTLTNHMVFDIFFTGGPLNFSAPHLKVDFWAALGQTKSTGDLLSQDIVSTSTVPLPGALPLFASGLAGLGLLGWRRKRAAAG